jgi:hypothetical protein
MSSTYVVRSGDTLTRIARAHGFTDWRTIYNHPDNAAFRAKRPNPDRIFPGDQLVIPGQTETETGVPPGPAKLPPKHPPGPAKLPPAPPPLPPVNLPPPIVQVTGMSAVGATMIRSAGNPLITHFVTPKGAGDVTLSIVISPDTPQTRAAISWEGATPKPGDPLSATVPKTAPLKRVVKVKQNGLELQDLRLWVVWSTTIATDIPIRTKKLTRFGPGTVGDLFRTSTGLKISGGFRFTHRILPREIITDVDRPDLRGRNTVAPPGGLHPMFRDPLAGGANRKWDSSRQVRAKVFNPAGIPVGDIGDPPPVEISYPGNDVEGNDDRTVGDEMNDPYAANSGIVTGVDSPALPIADRGGKDGDVFEWRLHFREFVRVELDGKWHRVSDFFPWRIHLKYVKSGGQWRDGGTNKATNNDGF